ncbi:hypothetical protein [Arsenicibacter rosenii]|uniref:Uncharacterized protein n=1 Tax=Arsenicibacter rosenii TaxID=1750698 RepID=A0A1S2VEJ2_9BACT|nr:hypothetical protein [Arsenicibacter rosenii]OIN57144.1 hypothetical protein BLX24_21580 [Arsenicibacter rosenii]
MKPTREYYLPLDAKLHLKDEFSTAVIYRYERNGNLIGMAFRGKSQKPAWHYRFKSAEAQQQYEQNFLQSVREAEEQKRKMSEQKNALHTLKEGDILYSSWGWEQTNIDFFQIIAVKSKTLTLQEIGATSVETTGWASDRVIADPTIKIGVEFKKRADGFNQVTLDRCRTATRYDGKPLHRSWYA